MFARMRAEVRTGTVTYEIRRRRVESSRKEWMLTLWKRERDVHGQTRERERAASKQASEARKEGQESTRHERTGGNDTNHYHEKKTRTSHSTSTPTQRHYLGHTRSQPNQEPQRQQET